MNKVLSIVVPAYNVGRELKRCIDSCLDQDLPLVKYEIIVVNDGSTDNTLQVANSFKNKGVKVYTQVNRGLGGARNTGLKYANGKYVWFIDSDDYLKSNILLSLLRHLEDNSLDCLFFRLQRIFEEDYFRRDLDEFECVQPSVLKDVVLSGREAVLQGYNPSSVCAIIFNTEFLKKNNLNFMLGIYHEDAEFTYRMICKTKRIKFIVDAPYLYFTHAGSMTRSKNIKSLIKNRVDDVVVALSYLNLANENKEDYELYSIIIRRAKSILFGLLWEMWSNRSEWGKNGINECVLNKMEQNNLYPLKPPYGSFKQAIISFVLLNNRFIYKM